MPPPSAQLSQSEALVMQTTRGSRDMMSTASSMVGWLGAITRLGSCRSASSARRSTRSTPVARITPISQRKPSMMAYWPIGSPIRRGRMRCSTAASRLQLRQLRPQTRRQK
jgi:hypothetical protein